MFTPFVLCEYIRIYIIFIIDVRFHIKSHAITLVDTI